MPPRLHDAYAPNAPAGTPRLLALRALVGLSGTDPASRTTEIHVGYVGEWNGHGDGPFKLSAEDLQSCVDAFNDRVNPISGDYEHASLTADGPPKPASMFIQALRTDGENLYATTEFTPRAAEMIRAGEYRYCSGVFAFNVPDRVAGSERVRPCVLRSCALTNDPFLDGQKPIALTAARALSTGAPSMKSIAKSAIIDALKGIEGEELTEAQFAALGTAVAAMAAAQDPKSGEKSGETELPTELTAEPKRVETKPGDENPDDKKAASATAALSDPMPPPAAEPPPPAPPTPPAALANADGAAMVGAKLVEATGMDGAALLAALETRLDAVVSAIRGSGGEVADLTAQAAASAVAALTAKIEANAPDPAKVAADAAAVVASEIDGFLRDGSILPGSVDTWKALAAKAPEHYRALKNSLPRGSAFPTGRVESLAKPDPNPVVRPPIDETKPAVVALRAMYAHRPKAEADAAVNATFGVG